MNILHEAAARGDAVTVRLQLSTAGALALLNTQDGNGATPLYCAARNGHSSVTEQLIEARCDVDLKANNGTTPIFLAAYHGHASVTEKLIEARCNIDVQEKNGGSPLHGASQNGHATVTEKLIEARCGARRNRHADTEHKAKRCQGCYSAG